MTVILNFPNNAFETDEHWCIAGLTAISRLLQRKNSTFFYSVVFIVTY